MRCLAYSVASVKHAIAAPIDLAFSSHFVFYYFMYWINVNNFTSINYLS